MTKTTKSKKELLQVFIERNMKRELKVCCAERGVTLRGVMIKLIADFLKTNETKILK